MSKENKQKTKKPFNVFRKGLAALAIAGAIASAPLMLTACGSAGPKGDTGSTGKSAYEIAVQYGFEGTEQEWLESLKGGTPQVEFDEEGYLYINGQKTEICIYKTEVPHEFVYNATTKGNYTDVKSKQGNALQTSGEAMNNRVSLWFGTYKFKKGTEFKLVGDLDEYSVGFSISRDGVEFDARKNAALADDSGWIDKTTTSSYTPAGGVKHAYNETTKTYTLMADGYVRANFKSTADATAHISVNDTEWRDLIEVNGHYLEESKSIHVKTEEDKVEYVEYGMNAVAHRGYSVDAPENTLAAYRLAKQKGFTMAECDVTFTKDGVGVLLHDDTIDRTSNGSGKISEMTLEEVRQYDFGSWKSSEYAGEKIPTFEEFIVLCKYLAIHPYIEIKAGATQTNVESLVTMVKRTGMLDKVTWISFDINMLRYVKGVDDTARLGYLAAPITETKITELKELRTGKNEVFFSADNTKVTEALIERCIEENIPLEVCTVDSATTIENLHPYITGVTSNYQISGKLLYDKYIN